MKSFLFTRKCSRTCSVTIFIIVIALMTFIQDGRAQRGQGPCFIPQYYLDDFYRWPPCATVQYTIASNIQGNELGQLNQAIAEWNAANITNGSRVQFTPGSSLAQYYLRIEYSYNIDAGGETEYQGEDSQGYLNRATIRTNPEFRFDNGDLYKDPNRPGYDTAFRKGWVHEIGHTMGLTHPSSDEVDPCYDQTPGASVMNTGCGVNDHSRNMQATSPTYCDNTTLGIVYNNLACPTPTPGCPSGQTNPHLECQNNACTNVNTCGSSQGGCTAPNTYCGSTCQEPYPNYCTYGGDYTCQWNYMFCECTHSDGGPCDSPIRLAATIEINNLNRNSRVQRKYQV